MKYLVTGSSGFIWFHLSQSLLAQWHSIVGFDNENDYYDIWLKQARRELLQQEPHFIFIKWDLSNKSDVEKIFSNHKIEKICNLWAQAGVRYSIENPDTYIQSNLVWFANIMEQAKIHKISHVVYASSSSVYGNSPQVPFSTKHTVDTPISLYAASKKANELIAHSYSHLFGISTVGLRFFTVYGPRGRPDMAYFGFLEKLYNNQSIAIYADGILERDFTYIDDIIDGIIKALEYSNPKKYSIFNLWNDTPSTVNTLVETLEKLTGKEFIKEYLPMQAGDVNKTRADISESRKELWYHPKTKLEDWLQSFVDRYRSFYNIS